MINIWFDQTTPQTYDIQWLDQYVLRTHGCAVSSCRECWDKSRNSKNSIVIQTQTQPFAWRILYHRSKCLDHSRLPLPLHLIHSVLFPLPGKLQSLQWTSHTAERTKLSQKQLTHKTLLTDLIMFDSFHTIMIIEERLIKLFSEPSPACSVSEHTWLGSQQLIFAWTSSFYSEKKKSENVAATMSEIFWGLLLLTREVGGSNPRCSLSGSEEANGDQYKLYWD